MTIEHACAIWIPAFIVLGIFVVMQWYGKMPSVESIQALAAVTNSKGGNILVLGGMSLVFFFTAIHLTYWCLERMMESKLTADNAIVMMGLTFVTGSAFGGSFSSMLKAMSGETIKETIRPLEPTKVVSVAETTTPAPPPSIPNEQSKEKQ